MMHSREKSDAAIVALAIVIRANFAELAQQSYPQLIRWSPLQWVIVALVKPLNVVAIEALVTDLHPGTQRAHGRKFLDGEPDRLGCGRKAAIAQLLSPTLALAHEQFGGYAVVERHSSRSAGFAFLSRKSTGKDCLDAKRALVRQPLRQPLPSRIWSNSHFRREAFAVFS